MLSRLDEHEAERAAESHWVALTLPRLDEHEAERAAERHWAALTPSRLDEREAECELPHSADLMNMKPNVGC